MMHKTLDSYYKGEPFSEPQQHPDGPLWLLTHKEFEELNPSTLVEATWGIQYYKYEVTAWNRTGNYTDFGIRGRKDD